MDLKWLKDFMVLARCHNFSLAAEKRNVTQFAFSRRIKALEEWMRVALVERKTIPVTLNAASTVWADSAYRSKTNEAWAGKERLEVGHPSAKAEGQTLARSDVAGKRTKIQDQVRRRACLRPIEGQDEALHQDHWHQQGKDEDGMANITYNMLRYVFHKGRRAAA